MSTATTLPATDTPSRAQEEYRRYAQTADAVWDGDPKEPDRFYDPTRQREKE